MRVLGQVLIVTAIALLPSVLQTFPGHLHRFQRHLDVLGRSLSTQRKYRYELLCWWTDYLFPRELELADVRARDVEEYLADLPANGSKRGDAIRALRAFCSWAHVEGEIDRDPIAHVPVPRRRVAPAPDLPADDLRRLLRAAFRREPRRGWAILLCYVTGARVGSLVKVRPGDVHLGPDARIDLLEAKGGKPYSVPLERAGVIAAGHLRDIRGNGIPADVTLVGVGAERFRQWVHAAEQEAGLGRVWPHLLRHAASTRVARSADPETWRRFMNHADLSQWSRYVAGTDDRVRAALPSP
jgi:integrase